MSKGHVLAYSHGDEANVVYRCGVCRQELGLNRQGFGEPWGSETYLPDNAQDYMDICPGRYYGTARNLTRDEFLARLSAGEVGELLDSNDKQIKGFIQKVLIQPNVDLDDPETLRILKRAEADGKISSGRPEAIVS